MSYLLFYGVCTPAYNDVSPEVDLLTSVRKSYFEKSRDVKNRIIKNVGNDTFVCKYFMENGKPLKWRISSQKLMLENSIKSEDGSYFVRKYDSLGNTVREIFFSPKHTLLKINYYNVAVCNDPVCVLESRVDNGEIVFLQKLFNMKKKIMLRAFDFIENKKVADIVYRLKFDYTFSALTNKGMVYYGTPDQQQKFNVLVNAAYDRLYNSPDIRKSEEEKPASEASDQTVTSDIEGEASNQAVTSDSTGEIKSVKAEIPEKFDFTPQDFSDVVVADEISFDNARILDDSYMNSIFAQVRQAVADIDCLDEEKLKPSDEFIDKEDEELYDEIAREDSEDNEIFPNVESESVINGLDGESAAENFDEALTTVDESLDSTEDEKAPLKQEEKKISSEFDFDFNTTDEFLIKPKNNADMIIREKNERYFYFGNIKNNQRCGRGRMELENGSTIYDGEYDRNMRDGFGCYYLKNGKICYVGDWKENRCNGVGVGYNSSDGSIHLGNWKNNAPVGAGARMSKNGDLLYATNKSDDPSGYRVSFADEKAILVTRYDKEKNQVVSVRIDLDDLFK